MRDLYEWAMDFGDFVRYYELAHSDGTVQRYPSDAYRALVRTVPMDTKAARCFGEFIHEQRMAFEAADAGDRLLHVGLAYVGYATDHRYAFALIFEPSVSLDADSSDSHQPLIDEHAELLVAALDDAISSGQLSHAVPPADLGSAMWSAPHGLASLITSGRTHRDQAPSVLSALLASPRRLQE